MENLPKEMLLKIIGDKKLEDFPNEVLVHIIADREKQMKLQQFEIDERQKIIIKQKDCIDELVEKIKYLEKEQGDRERVSVAERDRMYDDPPPGGEHLVTDLPQCDIDYSNYSPAQLKEIKKKNFYDFLKEKCEPCCDLVDNRITMGSDCHKQAFSTCNTIYKAFRNWAVENRIIIAAVKGAKNVFTTKEFYEKLVKVSKKQNPNIQVIYGRGLDAHKTKFGRKENPRVFIKLKNNL